LPTIGFFGATSAAIKDSVAAFETSWAGSSAGPCGYRVFPRNDIRSHIGMSGHGQLYHEAANFASIYSQIRAIGDLNPFS
jgi:hypothetical protein